MEKKDLYISNDDLADIFGAIEPSSAKVGKPAPAPKQDPEKKAEEARPAPKQEPLKNVLEPLYKLPEIEAKSAAVPEPVKKEEPKQPEIKSKLIMDRAQEAFRVQERIAAEETKKKEHPVDDLVKRAQEIEKEMANAKETELKFADFIDEKTVSDILHAFNDLKAELSKELAGKIDKRSSDNMLMRSIEKTAANFVLLKNTTWDAEGEMQLDGSINIERFLRNIFAYRDTIKEIDKEIEESLKAVMALRLIAVKKGLGADKYAEIRDGLIRRSAVLEGGYRKAISKFMRSNILENSIKKADESR